eukprot:1155229-Pelagomonas_calceolata.AAC.6
MRHPLYPKLLSAQIECKKVRLRVDFIGRALHPCAFPNRYRPAGVLGPQPAPMSRCVPGVVKGLFGNL